MVKMNATMGLKRPLGFGQHIEVGTVNGWRAVFKEIGVMRFQSMGKMGKNICSHFLQPLLENVDKKSCNDGSRGPYSNNSQPSPKMLTNSSGGG